MQLVGHETGQPINRPEYCMLHKEQSFIRVFGIRAECPRAALRITRDTKRGFIGAELQHLPRNIRGGGGRQGITAHRCVVVLAATINLVCKQILSVNLRLCVCWKALNYC